MNLRKAEPADVEAMVQLSESFRAHLATLSPVFWRKASDSAGRQAVFFQALLSLDDTIAVVAEDASAIAGFAIGRLTPAPPVYDPRGPVCLIDDFCLADSTSWDSVGRALLEAIEAEARERGAVLSVVVCPHLGGAKRELLAALRFAPTAEWHVRGL